MSALVSPIEKSNRPEIVLPHAAWRANQMSSYSASAIPSGFPALDQELPHGGWPSSMLIELLTEQAGIGEMRLLRQALRLPRQRRPTPNGRSGCWRNRLS